MASPLRVMFDTNIFGLLVADERFLIPKIAKAVNVIVYGCKVVRDELRDTPRSQKIANKNLRIELLNTYDLLVGVHDLQGGDLAQFLAEEYLKEYQGGVPRRKIFADFQIVAIASLKRLPVVCTEDNRTMASKEAIRVFGKVNSRNNLEEVRFIGLTEFKRLI